MRSSVALFVLGFVEPLISRLQVALIAIEQRQRNRNIEYQRVFGIAMEALDAGATVTSGTRGSFQRIALSVLKMKSRKNAGGVTR